MVFSSMIFLFVFLPIILFTYYVILQKHTHRNTFLFLSSLVFYAWGEPIYVLLMIFSILINFRLGILINNSDNKEAKKCILIIGIISNLIFLFMFKYEGFFVNNINSLFNIGIESLNLGLPIGISFFTFQALSYLVDVYRKTVPVQNNLIHLGLYISFFPQLVAGPIVRYSTIAEQIENRTTNMNQFSNGIKRFIFGVGKKVILANNLALISEKSFATDELSISFAWLGAIAYTLQIYFDFSGYSDMAIGLGKMFGFEFLENFNYPYISKTITEFWRRWHISLGSWFRDYVYFPLGGSRVKSKSKLILNLFVVWFLTGVWHGSGWKFIAWGMLYFTILVFEKLLSIPNRINKNILLAGIYQVFTIFFVIVGWVIFGENTLTNAIKHLFAMFGLRGNTFIDANTILYLNDYYLLIILGIILSTPLLKVIIEKIKSKLPDSKVEILDITSSFVYMIILFISISYLAIGAHNPFIYFNF
ncbi:MBOAT family O-acyltransferase [Romboutsia sp.]|uniref:MBOAT family O-acyltransferase n=1 Tax=Romboutsia sp. TaxID=1965302 RepID=UPI003F2C3230